MVGTTRGGTIGVRLDWAARHRRRDSSLLREGRRGLVLVICVIASVSNSPSLWAGNAGAWGLGASGGKAHEATGARTFVDMSPAELAKQIHQLKHLKSAESQEALPEILRRTGEVVSAFFSNFPNTTCTENVYSEIQASDWPRRRYSNRRYNYIALLRPGSDNLTIQEYRTAVSGAMPDSRSKPLIITSGYVSLLEQFHPALQSESRFRYLGRETMKGKNTLVVSFAQLPDRARHVETATMLGQTETIYVQGVAWIDPVSYAILRLRTDILKGEGSAEMKWETTDVDYSPVSFRQHTERFWLPRQVTVTGQLGNYSFSNQHLYSDYRIFGVQTEEELKSRKH